MGRSCQRSHRVTPDKSVTPEELIQFVKGQLGSVKSPKDLEIVEQLPRSSVGKVLKKEVPKKYWQNQERMV